MKSFLGFVIKSRFSAVWVFFLITGYVIASPMQHLLNGLISSVVFFSWVCFGSFLDGLLTAWYEDLTSDKKRAQ